jgi:hypothetical protein
VKLTSAVKKVIDIRVSSARRQIDNVWSFVKEPKGIFETVDAMVKNFRSANRETIEALGLRIPLTQRDLIRRLLPRRRLI